MKSLFLQACTLLFLIAPSFAQDGLSTFMNEHQLYGIKNKQEKVVVPPLYQFAQPFMETYVKIISDGKWGLLDADGKVIVPARYDYLGWEEEPFYQDFINKKSLSKIIFYDSYNKLLPFKEDNKWGLINISNGKLHETAQYDHISYFRNHLAIVKRSDHKQQLLYHISKKEISASYDHVQAILDHKAFIVGTQLPSSSAYMHFGVINSEGEELLPVQYSHIQINDQYLCAKAQSWHLFNFIGEEQFIVKDSVIKDFKIEDIMRINDTNAVVKFQGRAGVITSNGQVLIPFQYQEIETQNNLTFRVLPFTKWKICNQDHQTITSFDYEAIQPIGHLLFKYVHRGKWGIIHSDGSIITPPIYSEIDSYINDLAVVQVAKEYSVINPKGKEILPYFDRVYIDTLDYVKTYKNNKAGLYDRYARQSLPHEFENIKVITSELFAVQKNKLWGFQNAQSLWVKQADLDTIIQHNHKLIIGRSEGFFGVLDIWMQEKIPFVYDHIQFYTNPDYLILSKNEKKGLYDIDKEKILFWIDDIRGIDEKLALIKKDSVQYLIHLSSLQEIPIDAITACGPDQNYTIKKEGRYSIVNSNGQTLMPFVFYGDMGIFNEDLVPVMKNKKWGYANKKGNVVLSTRYGAAQTFKEGLGAVRINKKWGFINRQEMLVIDAKFQEVTPFQNGFAPAKINDYWGIINKRGQFVIEAKYDTVLSQPDGKWMTTKKDKKGLISNELKEILYAQYDSIVEYHNHYLVSKDEKWGLSNESGSIMIPVIYDYLYTTAQKDVFIAGQRQHWKTIEVK